MIYRVRKAILSPADESSSPDVFFMRGTFSPSIPSSGITVRPALVKSSCVWVNWICVEGLVEVSRKMVGACALEFTCVPLMSGTAK